MKLLGLTGGIGMGKTTSASILQKRDIPVIDTDQIAREVVAAGEPALAEIVEKFGRRVLDGQGALDRRQLAGIVFQDEEARLRLEAILHPRIRKCWLERAAELKKRGFGLGVVVIPLLFETQVEAYFDAVICVACKEVTQADRLRRRGWSGEHIRQRLGAQWPVEKKMALSDFVVWTEGTIETHREQLVRIIGGLN